jgi:hypothetical protein
VSAALRETQERFARMIMDPRPLADVAREDDVADLVTSSARQTCRERLDVYHSGYRARLVECLADDYPVMNHAMGDLAFEALCQEYIAAHPSRSPSLNRFGRHMAPFVLGRGCGGAHASFLRDLAVLEWAVVEQIHAAPVDAIDLDALQRVPLEQWASARFSSSGAVSLLDLDYPVNRFFQAVKEERSPAIPDAEATTTAVYRRGWHVWRMDLTPVMRRLLDSLSAGRPLGAALDEIAPHVASADDVMLTFREWVAGGFFGRIDVAP